MVIERIEPGYLMALLFGGAEFFGGLASVLGLAIQGGGRFALDKVLLQRIGGVEYGQRSDG